MIHAVDIGNASMRETCSTENACNTDEACSTEEFASKFLKYLQ